MKEQTYHLIKEGDSLGLTPVKWACGIKPSEGMSGYFGFDGTLHRINCGVCKRTKLYKHLKRSEAAHKAWRTIREKRKKAQSEFEYGFNILSKMEKED